MPLVDHGNHRSTSGNGRGSSALLARPATSDARRDDAAPLSDPTIALQDEIVVETDLEVRRISLVSVAHLATIFAFVTVVMFTASIAMLWVIASALHVTHHVEHFVHSLGFEGFTMTSTPVLLALWIAGTAWVVGVLVVAVVGAATYNWFASWFGGVHVSVAPDAVEQPRVR